MSPEQQQEVLDQLAGLLTRSLPGDWKQPFVAYRSLGTFVEPEKDVFDPSATDVPMTTHLVDAEVLESLPGEPPMSLLADRRRVDLPAGTEIDRYGDPSGNLVYATGTGFPQ